MIRYPSQDVINIYLRMSPYTSFIPATYGRLGIKLIETVSQQFARKDAFKTCVPSIVIRSMKKVYAREFPTISHKQILRIECNLCTSLNKYRLILLKNGILAK